MLISNPGPMFFLGNTSSAKVSVNASHAAWIGGEAYMVPETLGSMGVLLYMA